MLIKVCGMRDATNIKEVEKLGIDLMGFIFYKKSPRYVSEIPAYMPKNVKRVGVFVNEDLESVKTTAKTFGLDFIQLHGTESVDYCKELTDLGYSTIKAFSVKTVKDILEAKKYEKTCKFFIFDTKCESFGGSGVTFDWNILEQYHGETPFLLSGGLGIKTIEAILKFNHPKLLGYDLNSTFESSPAQKDTKLLKNFLVKLKYYEQNK